jgi:hypothetical protein
MLSRIYDPVFRLKGERITLCDTVGHEGRSNAVSAPRECTPEVGGSGTSSCVDTMLRLVAVFRYAVRSARKVMR